MKILSLPLVTILLSLAHPMHAAADSNEGMPADIGASVRMNALGTYDVGKELGGGALRNDLGPATLGFEVFAGIRPTNKLRIAGEFGLAIGGLVKTDERYFGSQSSVGSTTTVSAKASVGYSLGYTKLLRYRAGMVAGVERLSESSGSGYVRLDSVTGGAWFEVGTQGGWSLQLRAEMHLPHSASIQGQVEDASPGGSFSTIGVSGAYSFSLGAL
tara:strand:+ start:83207 stop:83851 length:645 start_codon:yes stop_codon:yes gene_type:complete